MKKLIFAVALALLGGIALAGTASAATLFSDNFEDGDTSGWSKSGGEWAVVADGSRALQQSKLDSELARMFAGNSGWTAYSAQARVKPTAFSGAGSFAGLAARVTGSTTMYRLVLLNTGRAELQVHNGSSVTVLGGATVGTGWLTLRLDVTGSAITGYVNGTRVASGMDTRFPQGRIGLLTYHATASFDDVVISDSATTPPSPSPSSSPTPGPTPSSPPPVGGLIGWATQGGGTTGGAGGATVTVSTLASLTTAMANTSPLIVQVNGNFACSADIRPTSNKTIVGVGADSGLTGCGINIRDITNVIVRNLKIAKVVAGNGNGDAIHLDNAQRVWIDHNDLSSDLTHGTDYYDGLMDITHASDYVTASWNRLHHHIKCSLVGHSDSNASEDRGHLRVTYHHNLFDTCGQRNPRVRFGNPVHVFNNYYVNNGYTGYSYGVASTIEGGVLVEGNYFENIADPFHVGEGSSPDGSLIARNNHFVNSGAGEQAGSVNPIPYAYTAESAVSVKSSVMAGAGTGRI